MYKTPCSRLTGLVGASVSLNLKILGKNAPRYYQSARSFLQWSRKDKSQWITYQHLNFLKRQYVLKSNNELYQRVKPKQTASVTLLEDQQDESVVRQIQDESVVRQIQDESVVRQIQQVPTIEPGPVFVKVKPPLPQPDISTPVLGAASTGMPADIPAVLERTSGNTESTSQTEAVTLEAPHVQLETDEAREARLDRQWKELKVELAELPDVYARLAKIKLTALVVVTAAAGFAMAPVPFDPVTFFLASIGTGLAACTANSINQMALCLLDFM